MKTIYIDSDFKCHVTADGTMLGVQTEVFDGKCDAFIEGYRFVPTGLSWTRSDGVVFHGEMAAPWKPRALLEAAQREHEQLNDKTRIAELEEALALLLSEVTE